MLTPPQAMEISSIKPGKLCSKLPPSRGGDDLKGANDPSSRGQSICTASCDHIVTLNLEASTLTIDLSAMPATGSYLGITNGTGTGGCVYQYSNLKVRRSTT